jgi:hypothetical protein
VQNKERGSTKNPIIRSNHGLKLVHEKMGPRALSLSGSEKYESGRNIFYNSYRYYTNLLLDLKKESTFDKLPN